MPDAPDYYELLGIAPDASDEEIRAAHRRAANYWHPDRNKSPDAGVMMRHVNSARDTLLSASKKQAYNLTSRVYQKWAGMRSGSTGTGTDSSARIRRESQRWKQKARETWAREKRRQKARAEQEARSQGNARTDSAKKPVEQPAAPSKKPRRRKNASNWAWVGISVMVIVVISGVLANVSNGGIAESALPASPAIAVASPTASTDDGSDGADVEATSESSNVADGTAQTPKASSVSPTATHAAMSGVPTTVAGPLLSPECSVYPGEHFYGPVDGTILSADGQYREPILPRGFPNVPDFDASISFTAPLDGLWNFGLVFRRSTDAWNALVISRSQTWTHQVYRNSYVTIADQGRAHNVRNLTDASDNLLRLVVKGSRAYAYLNGVQMASFALSSADVLSNEISPFVFNDIQKPVAVEFTDFMVSCPE